MQGYPGNSPEGPDRIPNAIPDILLISAASNIHRDVVDFRDGHPNTLSMDTSILSYSRNNSTSLTVFPKAEWVGISGVSEPIIVARTVIVAQEGVMDSGRFNLCCFERGMRRFALPLFREPTPLRPVKEGQVNPTSIYLEPIQKSPRIRWGQVGCSPKRQTIVEFDRLQMVIIKYPHVRAPLDSAI